MNKILEAILKGIQMGLEIQDDELDLPTFQKEQITSDYHANRVDQIKWARENFVDLGLPSGTLWCKWNLGATCEDTPESWYGNYYAWGEVETKNSFNMEAYKHCRSTCEELTKYNEVDNKTMLEPEDDVVSVTFGKAFRMPTKEDCKELCSLPSEWVKDYNGIKGLNGRVFIGNNEKQLFIPAAGYHTSRVCGDGSYCSLWSSSLHFAFLKCAYTMFCNSDNVNPYDDDFRYNGLSIRGVL